MRRLCFIWMGLWLCGMLAGIARGETFNLTDGRTVTGDVIAGSANATGVQIRIAEGKYERVSWTSFSQDDLKKLAQDPKMRSFARSFIVETPAERARKTQIDIQPVPRLARPAPHSILGGMFSSPLGFFVMLLLYAANIYAAYEISIFRNLPKALVCATSAVVPLVGPVIFLSLPSRVREQTESATRAAADAQSFEVPPAADEPAVNPMAADVPPPTSGGLKLAARTESGHSTTALPTAQVFQRGAYMFNRRFFETKFPGFFGVVRREADKDMVLLVKSARGEYAGERISRISASEMHVQVRTGDVTEEVMIPFSEIKEVQLKHKNA